MNANWKALLCVIFVLLTGPDGFCDKPQNAAELEKSLTNNEWQVGRGHTNLKFFGITSIPSSDADDLERIFFDVKDNGVADTSHSADEDRPVSEHGPITSLISITRSSALDAELAKQLHHVFGIADFSSQLNDQFILKLSRRAPLRALFAPKSKLTDAGIATLGKYPGLEFLDLSGCDISDKSFKVLAKLKYLRVVCLVDTRFSDRKLTELKERLPLCIFLDDAPSW